jgi:NTP pyrophosphatase (non-canonical NTP hydrolase)
MTQTQELAQEAPTFSTLQERVVQWARERRIIPNSNPTAQLMKTMSELGELADATLKRDDTAIVDGVGDVLVTLILYCELHGITMDYCLAMAYEQIKDRKGTLTPEGIFVKESA